jgi:hypothetical protein
VQLNDEINVDATLRDNWRTVRQWDDENRYGVVKEAEAMSLYSATTEPVSGMLEWIRRRW